MRKLTIFSALLALWGADLPVVAVESSIHHESVDAKLAKYWNFDHEKKIITNNKTLEEGANFTNLSLQEIFKDLANSPKHQDYTIELNNFLNGYTDASIDLSPIAQRIHRIGDWFLSGAKSLTTFDTNGLINVTSIGRWFLSCAYSLTTCDTNGLGNVTSIGDNFLYAATALQAFNTKGLDNVTNIGDDFLYGAFNLHTFDMQGLTSLKSAGSGFLNNAYHLRTVNMSGLNSRATIAGNTAKWMYQRQKRLAEGLEYQWIEPTCFKLKGGTIIVGYDQVFPIIDGWGLLQNKEQSMQVFKDLLSIGAKFHNDPLIFKNVYVSVVKIKRPHSDLELVSYLKIPVKPLVNGDNAAQPQSKISQIMNQIRKALCCCWQTNRREPHQDQNDQRMQEVKRALVLLNVQKVRPSIARHITGYVFSLCDQNLNELDTNGIQLGNAPALVPQDEESKDNQ